MIRNRGRKRMQLRVRLQSMPPHEARRVRKGLSGQSQSSTFATFAHLLTALVLTMAVVTLIGCGSSSSSGGQDVAFINETNLSPIGEEDIRLEGWINGESDDWYDFADAYEDGFLAGCFRLFEESPNDVLYSPDGQTFTPEDCTEFDSRDPDAASEIPDFPPDDPTGEGYRIGFFDGCFRYLEWAGPDLGDGSFQTDPETCYNP